MRNRLQARHPGLEVEIVTVKTSGDRGERDRLGAFVREIQDQLLSKKVNVALHCLKDLPTAEIDGLHFVAYLEREDPRDTIISRGPVLTDLPVRSVVGTGSVRRTSQLAAVRPDLVFRPLVGNVDTRLRRLVEGDYDAIVLAIAGLKRLGLTTGENHRLVTDEEVFTGLTVHPLSTSEMMPAPGQAVLVLETRRDDEATADLVSHFDHLPTRQCADAERAFLRTFGGGCSVPVAALAVQQSDELSLRGLVATPDGVEVISGVDGGPLADATLIGERLARQLGDRGAFAIVERVVKFREGLR